MVKQLIQNNIYFSWLFKINFFKSKVITFISVHVFKLFNHIKLFGLPIKTSKFRVIRSPHLNKKSMESFYIVKSKFFSNSFNLYGLEIVRKLSELIEMFMKFLSLTSLKTKSIILKIWNSYKNLTIQFSHCIILFTFDNSKNLVILISSILLVYIFVCYLEKIHFMGRVASYFNNFSFSIFFIPEIKIPYFTEKWRRDKLLKKVAERLAEEHRQKMKRNQETLFDHKLNKAVRWTVLTPDEVREIQTVKGTSASDYKVNAAWLEVTFDEHLKPEEIEKKIKSGIIEDPDAFLNSDTDTNVPALQYATYDYFHNILVNNIERFKELSSLQQKQLLMVLKNLYSDEHYAYSIHDVSLKETINMCHNTCGTEHVFGCSRVLISFFNDDGVLKTVGSVMHPEYIHMTGRILWLQGALDYRDKYGKFPWIIHMEEVSGENAARKLAYTEKMAAIRANDPNINQWSPDYARFRKVFWSKFEQFKWVYNRTFRGINRFQRDFTFVDRNYRKRKKESWADWYRYAWEARDDLEQSDWFPVIPLLDYRIPLNVGELKRQFFFLADTFFYDLIWKPTSYSSKVTVEDFAKWINDKGDIRSAYKEATLDDIEKYLKGFDHYRKMDELSLFESSYYYKWFPGMNHPFFTNVLNEKKIQWVDGYDIYTNEPVMIRYKGKLEDNNLVEVISYPDYLHLVRSEQDLLRDREQVTLSVAGYFDQYTYDEFLNNEVRKVTWMKEYSSVLHSFEVNTLKGYNPYFDLYFRSDNSIWNDDVMWNDHWEIHDGEYSLHQYLLTFELMLREYWHFDMFTSMFKIFNWFWVAFGIDSLFKMQWWWKWEPMVLYRCWRIEAIGAIRKRTGFFLFYTDKTNVFIFISIYWWFMHHTRNVLNRMRLWEQYVNALKKQKLSWVVTQERELNGYGFAPRTDNPRWLQELPFFGKKNKFKEVWKDKYDAVIVPTKVTQNNTSAAGSIGKFSEIQLYWFRNLPLLKSEWLYVISLMKETFTRFFIDGALVQYFWRVVLVEYSVLSPIVSFIFSIPNKIWLFSCFSIKYVYNFIIGIPELLWILPSFLMNVFVAFIQVFLNIKLSIIFVYNKIVEEIINFGPFLSILLKEWVYLLYETFIIYPIRSFWNLLERTFNLTYYRPLITNWKWYKEWDTFHLEGDYTLHETAINWIRHYQRTRPTEHYTKLELRDSWTDFLAIFSYYSIMSSSFEEVINIAIEKRVHALRCLYGEIQRTFQYFEEWGFFEYIKRRIMYICSLISFLELPPNEEWNFYRKVNLYVRHWINKGGHEKEEYLETELKFLYECFKWYLGELDRIIIRSKIRYFKAQVKEVIFAKFQLQMAYGGFALDWWFYNMMHSMFYYPIVFIWRHTVMRAFVSIRYVFNLIWHRDYYGGWNNFTLERLSSYFKLWRSNCWASFTFIFSSFKESCIYNISFMFNSIIYPFSILKNYFLEIINNIYEFLWGFIYQYCHFEVLLEPVYDFIYEYLGFYNYALGLNFDLTRNKVVKENEPTVNERGDKIIGIVELFDHEKNNKLGNDYELRGNLIYDFEKKINHPDPLLPTKPNEGWVANKALEKGMAEFYKELGQVNIFEDKFPLTPHERVLDNANILDRADRNLRILLMMGREVEDVRFVQDIVGRYLYDKVNEYEEKEDIYSQEVSLWVTFHDWLIQYPSISAFDTIYNSYCFWADKYIKPVYLFFFEGDGGLITLEFFLCLPARIKYVYKNIPVYYNYLETKLIWFLNSLITNIEDMYTYSKEFLRITYGLSSETFSFQFFIDMFFYWYYIIPYKDWKTTYLNNIFNENWLFVANYFNKLNNVFIINPGERKNNFLELTRVWAYYHKNHWEHKSYFENSSWKSYYDLTCLMLRDYHELRKQYVENKFYLTNMKFYNKFDYSRETIIPWHARYGGNLFFEKEELIEYLSLRCKYSIMFFFKFLFDSFVYGINLISFDIATVIFSVFSAPLNSLYLYNKYILFLSEYKLGYRNVKNQFYFDFTELYIKPSVDTCKQFYNLIQDFILLYYNQLLNLLYQWYIVPVKTRYDVDLRNIFNFKFYELFIIWNEMTVNLVKYHLNNVCNIFVFLIKRTWIGIENVCSYLNDVIIDPVFKYIVVNYIFSLKVKIVIFISNYFQELGGRVNSIEGFFKEFFIVKRNIKISIKRIKGFDDSSIIEFICALSDSMVLVLTIIKGIIQTIGAYFYWMFLDILKYIKIVYNLIEKFVHFSLECYLQLKYFYINSCSNFVVFSSKLFWLNVDLLFAMYNFILGLLSEWILFSSKVLNVICVDILKLEFLGKYILMFVDSIKETIMFFYHLCSSFISLFVEYDKTYLRVLDVRSFLIKFNMYFTDFYQWTSRGEYWWDNIVFARIYWSLLPIKEWIEYNLEYKEGTRSLLIRGDYGRKMHVVLGDHKNHMTEEQKNRLWGAFENQGYSRGFPIQAYDLFTLNNFVMKYLVFLQETNLPRVIKKHYWGLFIERYFYQSLVNIAGKTATDADVIKYFEMLLAKDHFGIRQAMLQRLDEITNYSGTMTGFEQVITVHKVPDQGFRYWWGNIWTHPGFLRDINPFSGWDFEDTIGLGNGAMDLWDEVYSLNLDLIESWELVWGHTYFYKDDMNVLDYHIALKEALDTYEFMAFNQKLYNFYLDMFGPSFAYLLYHFPGHSLQLNDDNFSYYEKVQWLREYIYSPDSTLFSNLSLLHRLKTWDFHNYMKAAQSAAKSGETSKDYARYRTIYSRHHGKDLVRDICWFGKYDAWDKDQFASSVIPNLQWYVNFYEPMYYDEERTIDHIFAMKDDGGGAMDYGTLQVGESWFNEWDYRRQDIGITFSYRIPFDWFYTSKWVDYENSPVKQFFFNSSTFMFRLFGDVGLEDENVYKGRFERTIEKVKYKQHFTRPDLDQGLAWDWNIPNILMEDRHEIRSNEYYDEDYEWTKVYLETFLVTRDVYYNYRYRFPGWSKSPETTFQRLHGRGILQFYPSRDFQTVILDDPNINVEQYNQMINERMVEKPLCYNYWIFYEGMDNAASSVNNFENLNVLSESMFYDAPSEWQYGFQDPASPIMEGIIDLHHDLFFFMILVSVFVIWVLFNILYYFNSTNYNFKIRIQKWVHEEIRETLLDLVNLWYALTIRLVNMASASNNSFINVIAQKFYDITMLFIYWENKYFNKWYHEKELEHLVVNSKLYSNSLLPKNIVDILKYIGQNDYDKVEYFYNEVEKKGYFISKNNVELYNKFKNDPNNTCYSSRVGTVLNNLVSVRDLQLQLSSLYFTDMVKEKEHINKVISDNILEYENFEEDFEEYQLKEEFVWFPQLFVHNTTIEVIWTIIPAVILIFIAVPSFSLLYAMDQIWQPLFTIKVLGNQWYWSYEYC